MARWPHRPGVAAKRRNPRLSTGIAPRLDHASIDAAACAIGHGATVASFIACATPKACPLTAGGVSVSPTPPDATTHARQPRRGFRGNGRSPGHDAAGGRAGSIPRQPLRGCGVLRTSSGGSGEAPQPPATFGNRFAIGSCVNRRVRHAEGVPVDSRGCRRFADTPGRNDRCPSTPKSV